MLKKINKRGFRFQSVKAELLDLPKLKHVDLKLTDLLRIMRFSWFLKAYEHPYV